MLNLKKWMQKVTETLKDILSPTDYGSSFTHNYSSSTCHIYKIGKIVFFQYGTYWGGSVANTAYTIGTLPTAVRPSYDQICVGQMSGSGKNCLTPLTVYIATSGSVSIGSTPYLTGDGSGYPWFSCIYFV